MKYGKHFMKQMKDPAFLKALAQERLITDIQEEICQLMQENNVSRIELAKRMGKSKGFITQILNSGRNLTLRTVADVFTALGTETNITNNLSLKQDLELILDKIGQLEHEQQEIGKRDERLLQAIELLTRRIEILGKRIESFEDVFKVYHREDAVVTDATLYSYGTIACLSGVPHQITYVDKEKVAL